MIPTAIAGTVRHTGFGNVDFALAGCLAVGAVVGSLFIGVPLAEHLPAGLLKRMFGVDVELKTPKVPYRETITRRAENVEGKLKKQTGGKGMFGVCFLTVEPMARGEGIEFVDEVKGGAIPRGLIPAVFTPRVRQTIEKDRKIQGLLADLERETVKAMWCRLPTPSGLGVESRWYSSLVKMVIKRPSPGSK